MISIRIYIWALGWGRRNNSLLRVWPLEVVPHFSRRPWSPALGQHWLHFGSGVGCWLAWRHGVQMGMCCMGEVGGKTWKGIQVYMYTIYTWPQLIVHIDGILRNKEAFLKLKKKKRFILGSYFNFKANLWTGS